MKIAVFVSDNRPLDSKKDSCTYNSYVAYINTMYCLIHKYDFYYFQPYSSDSDSSEQNNVYVCRDPNTNEKRHASWAKLISASILCNTNNCAYDYVVCIDSDCVFKNLYKRIESVIDSNPTHDIIVANNSPYHPHLPCCAFFICKNTEWTRTFLTKWYNYKNPSSDSDDWSRIIDIANRTYKTPQFKLGEYWEQDTLWLMIQDPDVSSHIHSLEEPIMFAESTDQYLIHLSHERHDIRNPYFRGYVEHLEGQTKQSFETILSIIPVIQYDTAQLYTDRSGNSHSH
jgi:hypothetical protein